MIIKKFVIDEQRLHYFIGISQINFEFEEFLSFNHFKDKKEALNHVFAIAEEIQNEYEGSVLQLVKKKNLLNEDHIYTACYYVQKTFSQGLNISKSKNIELLLYLIGKRQIKKGIEAFGINEQDLKDNSLTFCIISPINNLNTINQLILEKFNAIEAELDIDDITPKKLKNIKLLFELSEKQISVALNSNKSSEKGEKISITDQTSAIYDLICEKMVILSLEKITTNFYPFSARRPRPLGRG